MKETDFKQELKDGPYMAIGKFQNDHGEEYVLFRFKATGDKQADDFLGRNVYLTGDELDWEIGWRWVEKTQVVVREFQLSEDEAAAATKIYNKFVKDKIK